jgi:hypothetical protein
MRSMELSLLGIVASGRGRVGNMGGAWAMDQHRAVDAAYGPPMGYGVTRAVGRASAHVPGPGLPFETH